MEKFILAVLAALASIVAPSAAIAQQVLATPVANTVGQEETPVATNVSMTETFVQNLGMTEVLPNFHLSAGQMEELRTAQCTGGPTGLFSELREWMREEGETWCSRETNERLSRFFRSGAVGYTLMAGPTGVRLTVYDQAVNLNRNVRCIADIPYSGVFQLQFTCFDAQSGAQVRSQIVGTILGNAIPMWGATVLSNLTAPRAGNTNISVAGNAVAAAEATAPPPAPVNVSAIANIIGGCGGPC